MSTFRNVGSTDRLIRAIIGLVVVAIGVIFHSRWGLLAAVPLLSAVVGFCPKTRASDCLIDKVAIKEGDVPMATRVRVLLVGETWVTLKINIKGIDMFPVGGYEDFGAWFMEAMDKFEDIQAEHMPNHLAIGSFPSDLEALNRYDVVIFSDCGKNTIALYPEMFPVPMGPDRLALVKEYVEKGKAFVMADGWNSFPGLNGILGYHGTHIEEIPPVQIQASDDRMETPQGVRPRVLVKDHPVFIGLPAEWPLFLGYNKVTARSDAHGRAVSLTHLNIAEGLPWLASFPQQPDAIGGRG